MKVRLLSLLISTPLSFTLGCGAGPTEPLAEKPAVGITPPTRTFPTPRPTHPSFPTPCAGNCISSFGGSSPYRTPTARRAQQSEGAPQRDAQSLAGEDVQALPIWPAAAIVFGTAPTETNIEPSTGAASRSIRADVEWATDLALKKLEKPNCRLIFSDFVDSAGRTLQQNLDNRRETGSDLLRRLRFRDGTGLQPCGYEGVLAFTAPGGPMISICRPAFGLTLRGHPALAANILLHEELHRLGLEESSRFEKASSGDGSGRNRPPTSSEITDRVAARCGS